MQSGNKQMSTLMAMSRGMLGKKQKGRGIPTLGHAMSGTQLGQVDSSIRNAQGSLAKFAEGGGVKKPAGPSAKERREIRDMIERGKEDAIDTLRTTRSALASTSPPPPEDYTQSLDALSGRLALKDGGEVDSGESDVPTKLYEQYKQLMDQLHAPNTNSQMQMQLVDQLSHIVSTLESMGVSVPPDDESTE
jgi:hypothetical protein